LADWLERANVRHHRALEGRPIDRLEADRTAMVSLPPVAPVVGWRTSTRLARDQYVRTVSNDYSVHPACLGRLVEVVADLESITVTCAGGQVARHERCWAIHQTVTHPVHAEAAARLRRARLTPTPAPADTEVERRSLSVYDALAEDTIVAGLA
jgi:hypothetical protein